MNNATIAAAKTLYAAVSYSVLLCDTEYNVLWANIHAQKAYAEMLQDKQLVKYFLRPNRHMALIELRENDSFEGVLKVPDNTLHAVTVSKLDGYIPYCILTIHSAEERPQKVLTELSPDSERILQSLCDSFAPQISINYNMLNKIKATLHRGKEIDPDDLRSLYVQNLKMHRAIRNIDEYKNLCANKIDFQPVRLNVSRYLNQLFEEIQLQLEEMHIPFSYTLKADEEIISYTDQKMLSLMVVNLVANAAFYSESGTKVKAILRQVNGEYLIAIKNKGPLLPRKILSQLFTPYYSYDPNKNAPAGIGLGLTICRMIAALHEGECKFSSTKKYGNVSTVRLPILKFGSTCVKEPITQKDPYGYIELYLSNLK